MDEFEHELVQACSQVTQRACMIDGRLEPIACFPTEPALESRLN